MDLFDLLEKLFRGIVYFIYNVVETTTTVLWHPTEGPIRLYRRYLRPKTRQLGGMTYLFIALFLFNSISLAILSAINQPEDIYLHRHSSSSWFGDLTKALMQPPDFSSDAIWPNLLASLISTVIIDAVLRLVLRRRVPTRPAYRQMILAASEYAMAWMIIAALSMATLFSIVTKLWGDEIALLAVFGWGIVSLTATSLPAARFLGRARPIQKRRGSGRRSTALWMISLAAIFMAAIFIGLQLALGVQSERDAEKSTSARVRVKTLRCENRPDGRFDVDALVYVTRTAPQALGESDFSVEFEYDDAPRSALLDVTWRSPGASPFLVVSDGQPVLAALRTKDPVMVSLDWACRASAGLATDGDPAPITGYGLPQPVVEDIM